MSSDTSCLQKPFDKHSRNSHKLKFPMKSWTFSYSTFDLTDSLFMRYFTKRKLIQNLLLKWMEENIKKVSAAATVTDIQKICMLGSAQILRKVLSVCTE